MEESPPVTRITDLPNELLEMFLPDLESRTISTMKLVNKRFYQVFSGDIFYKAYMKYPVEHVLCSMKNKKSGEIAEEKQRIKIIEEIENGEIGKWKGLLTLEKLHLKNWRDGRITRCEKIPLPPLRDKTLYNGDRTRPYEDLIDEDGEHWLLNSNQDGDIVLINVTSEPKIYVEEGTSTKRALLLHGQVMSFTDSDRIVVFDIVKTKGEISLRRKYEFQLTEKEDWYVAKSYKRAILVSVRAGFGRLVHFRDLKTGTELEDLRLWDYDCVKQTMYFHPDDLKVRLFKENLEYPYVVMEITNLFNSHVIVAVYNVESMKIASFVKVEAQNVNCHSPYLSVSCCVTNQVVYIFSKKVVYSLPLEEHGDVDTFKTLRPVYHGGRSYVDDNLFKLTHGKPYLLYGRSRFLLRTHELHVVSLNESNVKAVFKFKGNFQFPEVEVKGFIEPDVMVVNCGHYIMYFKLTKVEKNGRPTTLASQSINWNTKLCKNKISFDMPCPVFNSKDFTKIVFYNEQINSNDFLAICYF